MDFRDINPLIKEVALGYQYSKPPQALLFFQDLLAKIERFIYDLLSNLQISLPSSSAKSYFVANVMQFLLLLSGFLAIIALLIFAFKRMGQIKRQSLLARRGESILAVELDALGWRNQAEEFAKAGDYKLACRALYLSLLKQLSEKEVLEFVPTRTNYEYWYALSRHKELARSFRELANLVESSWFGKRAAGQDDYQSGLRTLASAEDEIAIVQAATEAARKAKALAT